MRRIISKFIRLLEKLNNWIRNFLRIAYLNLKYPHLRIDFKSKIQKNCNIICVDGGSMIIKGSSIAEGTHLFADMNGSLQITNSIIGRFSCIVAKKQIIINSGCAIAEMVVIRDQDHKIDTQADTDAFSSYSTGSIIIGQNVWIASKVTILKNVSIGDYVVIAASAVVNKSIPSYELWAGVPAKFVKHVH